MHLTLENIAKDYGNIRVLDDVNLEINEGEFCVLLGPSGCGKSTLLRMVAGLETISAGTLLLSGKVLNDVHPRDRDMAMVFQNYALYPQMTVRRNIEYPLKLAKLSADQRKAKVNEAANFLELTPYLDRKPGELSGGQRQRVAMGRAIVRDPKVFLMDEPLSNLDARLRAQMRVDIRNIQQSLGVTTLYVTHDQVEAMTMADRIVVLSDGKIQQTGTPDEIYAKPANRFVASFIGSPPMNFIDAPELTEPILNAFEQNANEAELAIRPEDIALEKPQTESFSIEAICTNVEALGAETLCYFTFLQNGKNQNSLIARWPGNLRDMKGARHTLYLPKDKIALFTKTTGERIPIHKT